jgi:hypothetical protein
MAKTKEEPIVDNEVGSLKVKEKQKKQPDGNETKGNVTEVKEKMKMEPVVEKESITKVDLNQSSKEESKPESEPELESVEPLEEITEDSTKEDSIEKDKVEDSNDSILEEVTEEAKKLEETVTDAIIEADEKNEELPENIQKLLKFMEDTGGDLQDYVSLNKDYSELDNNSLLTAYYKQTRPHLNEEEIDFLMEDQFSFNEEEDEAVDVKRKKLALKEQVAEAKQHLESVKSKYYEDIKAGSKLTSEQQKAIDFFNRYNKESKDNKQTAEKQKSNFLSKTNQVFDDNFKGFEYNVGEKKFRFNVKDTDSVKETQSNINNFVKKFLNKDNEMDDARGYHKSLFTAMNPDKVANHFYEQGKADALKESIAKSKNIDMDPRQQLSGETNIDGMKVKVLGESSSDFKFKIKQK